MDTLGHPGRCHKGEADVENGCRVVGGRGEAKVRLMSNMAEVRAEYVVLSVSWKHM